MNSLEGKKILFFAPKFFNYEVAIKEEMEHLGAEVHLYDERGNPSSLGKILIRKLPFIIKSKILSYYKHLIEQEKYFSPDYVFFLSPETVTKKCIELMKQNFNTAKFVLYMYDSIQNKNAKHIYKYFDRCLSFDPNDCSKYGFIFRPLFYIKTFESLSDKRDYKYDFCFIGTIHSDRAKILYHLKQYFDTKGFSYFYYLYIPGKMLYLLRWILNKYVRKFGNEFIHTKSIDKQIVSDISKHSKCTIDINHPKQVGLTMRTIEMVGLKQKILTTNENIKKYDFYIPENQLVISRSSIDFPTDKIISNYKEIDENIYQSYNLNSWIDKVFEL